MKQEDLRPTTYRHLRHDPYCSYCGEYIEKEDDLEYTKIKQGHRVKYRFYHSSCWEEYNG